MRQGSPHETDERGEAQHYGDKKKLPDLDADVEKQKGYGNVAGGEADFAKRSGKAETVKQPESEGHEPWRSGGDAGVAVSRANYFQRDEGDRERDRRFHWLRWHVDKAEGVLRPR